MFNGKFERISSENLDAFMTSVKACDAWKKSAADAKSTMEVNSQEGLNR